MSKAKEKITEVMKEVFIPKQSRNDNERFVAVNGERILVQTGKRVSVPERFAEVLENSAEMEKLSEEYIAAKISV